jgi:hypothetical protein
MTVSAEGRDAVDMDTKFGSASRIRRGALFASYYVIYHSHRVWTWVQTLGLFILGHSNTAHFSYLSACPNLGTDMNTTSLLHGINILLRLGTLQ